MRATRWPTAIVPALPVEDRLITCSRLSAAISNTYGVLLVLLVLLKSRRGIFSGHCTNNEGSKGCEMRGQRGVACYRSLMGGTNQGPLIIALFLDTMLETP